MKLDKEKILKFVKIFIKFVVNLIVLALAIIASGYIIHKTSIYFMNYEFGDVVTTTQGASLMVMLMAITITIYLFVYMLKIFCKEHKED